MAVDPQDPAHLRLIGNVSQRNSLLAVDAADLGAFKDDGFLFGSFSILAIAQIRCLSCSHVFTTGLTGDVGSGGNSTDSES